MIPLAIPRDNHIVNLSNIYKVEVMSDGSLDVHFIGGHVETYKGEAARNVNLEIQFLLNQYREFQQAVLQGPSKIIAPTGDDLPPM